MVSFHRSPAKALASSFVHSAGRRALAPAPMFVVVGGEGAQPYCLLYLASTAARGQLYCRPANSLRVLTAPGGGATSRRPSYWQLLDAISIPGLPGGLPRVLLARSFCVPASAGPSIPPLNGPELHARKTRPVKDSSFRRLPTATRAKKLPVWAARSRRQRLGITIMTHYTASSTCGARTPMTEMAKSA